MHAVERWAYAVDTSTPRADIDAAAKVAGYALVEDDPAAKAARYEAPSEGRADGLVLVERPDLGVTILQAFGPTTPDRLGPVLEKTGFVPQSSLLARAYDLADPRAPQALTALAHMVVAWDDDWADLFLLHLAAPDPVVRHTATLATVIAALSARSKEPARSLLLEARRRERYPKLKDTMGEALAAVEAIAPAAP